MKTVDYKGVLIRKDDFRWEVAGSYRFKTLRAAKDFIDRNIGDIF